MRVSARVLGFGLFASALAFGAPPAFAQNPPQAAPAPAVPTETALADFEAYVAQTLAEWNIPGLAISVVRDGETVLAAGYGARDPASGAAMTEDTIFPIASMSKAFTSFGAGLLVDEGRMSFDAPVAAYIPGLALHDPAASAGLALRDMLSHRSGLPRHDAIWYHNEGLTRDALVPRLAHLEESAPFRARFQYNNIMFVLSGLAIERVAGRDYESFTRERIFAPLGMARTMFSPEEAAADPNHTSGTEVLNGERINVPLFRNTPILNPAGGVYSTAEDLAQWMRVHLSEGRLGETQVIAPATLADMHATRMVTGVGVREPEYVPTGYGLGWFTAIYRGRRLIQHGGNLNGVSTIVMMIPEERLGVTVLINQGQSELRDAMARAVLDRFLGESGRDWVGEALGRKRAA
ncbi:MAG: beta-lactamase family protein, partial [Sphingomonadaceae bacterium]|nr:beta-lactamase family protein [Sphingomonadaceae bacterium]